jgi:hypothetical protein
MALLALMLPCQCMAPRTRREEPDFHAVAVATPLLDDEIVYGAP